MADSAFDREAIRRAIDESRQEHAARLPRVDEIRSLIL